MSYTDRMKITVPEGEVDGMRVERFEIGPYDLNNLRAALREDRGTRPGMYTRLVEGGEVWMSDVDAEKRDHIEPVKAMWLTSAERVLINGLGLGMVLQAALSYDHVKHVDVVEKDERVIKLIGPHYTKDPRVTIHHADAYEQMKAWPKGSAWDVAWTDIWPSLEDTAVLKEMAQFNRSYSRRSTWHGCWGHKDMLRIRAKEKRDAKDETKWMTASAILGRING